MQTLSQSGHKHGHSKASSKRKAQRVQRACSNCRKRKQGCEEERPCKRCLEKGIECVEVEPKRKRGRVRGQSSHSQRFRSDSRSGDEMADYDEDEDIEEDFCESDEDEIFTDEDPSNTASPRRSSPMTSANSSTNSMKTHVFRLNNDSSNTSSSNLHSTFSKLETSFSNSDVSSYFSFPIVKSSSTSSTSSSYDLGRDRSSSVSSDITGIPDSPSIVDPLDELEDSTVVHMEMEECMEDYTCSHRQGLNLALLLPFIGNLENSNDRLFSTPMFMDDDDDYDYLLNNTLTNDSNCSSLAACRFSKSSVPSCSDSSMRDRVWNSDLPFYTSATKLGRPPYVSVDEGDTRAQVYLKGCWDEFLIRGKDRSLDVDMQRVRESWKEIIKCLRGLEWQKLQGLLRELETLPTSDYFGGHIQPAMLFWTSGGRIHHANESFCKMVCYSEEELRLEVSLDMNLAPSAYYGHKMRAHSIFHPDEMMKILKRQLEAIQHPDKSSYQMNTRLLSKYRQEIPVSCSILNMRDTVGLSLLTVAIFV